MNKVTYLRRSDWGGGPIRSGHVVPLGQFEGLVVHHTVIILPDYDHDSMVKGDIDDVIEYMRRLQHARPDLGDEVPYSFVHFEGAGDGDVIVAEGRGFGITGAHTIGYNSTRYGCALAGDYTDHAPTTGQWNGIRWIGAQLVAPIVVATIEHRDVYQTACPGAMTPAPALAQPPFIIPISPTEQEQDMLQIIERADGRLVIAVVGIDSKVYVTEQNVNGTWPTKFDQVGGLVRGTIDNKDIH